MRRWGKRLKEVDELFNRKANAIEDRGECARIDSVGRGHYHLGKGTIPAEDHMTPLLPFPIETCTLESVYYFSAG
ncbi:MAG: hypothetical protein HY531_03320 [Chloroflexi bacterium]|nr:hypothetical protein [Chloroflexota bacterium]